MIKFCYDNIEANNLILEFKCKECHTLTETELLSVPKMDFDTFKNVSSLNKHKCQCGACYTIEIINGLYDSYGLIHRVIGKEEDVQVHEIPDYPYSKDTILVDTIGSFSKIESIIDGIEDMRNDDKNYVYCLLFSNLITILDSFIKIYTEPIIMSDYGLIESFSTAFGIKNGKPEEKKHKIRVFYKTKSFQSISAQKKLFTEVFNVNVDIDDRIGQYVAIRSVIIHRNAIDTKGYTHKIRKSQLLQALWVIKDYINHIFMELNAFETQLIVERTINK